jgi:RNA polymerase sigma factor (sigma-70 family)
MKLPHLKEHENEWFMLEIYPHESALAAWLKHRYPSIRNTDDVVQESFLRVLKISRKLNLSAPKAYLFATARNICVDLLRREKIVNFHSLTGLEHYAVEKNSVGVREEIISKEEFRILTEAIKQLPKKCRRVITLRKVYGMTAKQIAAELKLSHRTVQNQILIGIKKCREYYSKMDGSFDNR